MVTSRPTRSERDGGVPVGDMPAFLERQARTGPTRSGSRARSLPARASSARSGAGRSKRARSFGSSRPLGKRQRAASLRALLDIDLHRPMYAHVADHNIGSRRVLEKCGSVLDHRREEVVWTTCSCLSACIRRLRVRTVVCHGESATVGASQATWSLPLSFLGVRHPASIGREGLDDPRRPLLRVGHDLPRHREGQRDRADAARRRGALPVRGHGAVRVDVDAHRRAHDLEAVASRRHRGGLPAARGNALVAVSENMGTPTSIVSLIIALIPLWLAFFDRVVFRAAPLGWKVVVGLIGGFTGAALLVSGSAGAGVPVGGMLVAVAATLCWTAGSLYARSGAASEGPAARQRHAATGRGRGHPARRARDRRGRRPRRERRSPARRGSASRG